MSIPRHTGRYKVRGMYPEDRRCFGALLSRRVRAMEKAEMHKLLTQVEESSVTFHLVSLVDYVSPPEHMRNCELPPAARCATGPTKAGELNKRRLPLGGIHEYVNHP